MTVPPTIPNTVAIGMAIGSVIGLIFLAIPAGMKTQEILLGVSFLGLLGGIFVGETVKAFPNFEKTAKKESEKVVADALLIGLACGIISFLICFILPCQILGAEDCRLLSLFFATYTFLFLYVVGTLARCSPK